MLFNRIVKSNRALKSFECHFFNRNNENGLFPLRFISFEGRHWHSQCFVCALCKVSMAGKGFIADGEDIICPECAKERLMGGGGGGSGSNESKNSPIATTNATPAAP